MSPRAAKLERGERRQSILEALARELEERPGERITTAQLASAVGVSEAALYRHFPSKAKMFEGLIEFIEDTVFSLANRILADEKNAVARCEKLCDRVETQLKQVLREARLQGLAMTDEQVQTESSLLLAVVEGRLQQFVRSGFERSPLAQWPEQWTSLKGILGS